MSDLNPKQQRFVLEYVKDLNATQAAIRAGYSAKSAEVNGPRLLGNAQVKAAVAQLVSKQIKTAEITADLVLDGLLTEARRTGEGSSHGARVTAWAKLGEYLKLFVQKHEHEHKGSIEHTVKEMAPNERVADAMMIMKKAREIAPSKVH